MAVASRRTRTDAPKQWSSREASPERTKVWTEPKPKVTTKVPVVYYLSRNGHLEHPHFMEVPISSPDGLHLRDVINRLNSLRGIGMAALYSWSSKRSYKNGFVWHDLTEDDFIYPAHGHEYVLKGSELLLSAAAASAASSPHSGEKAVVEDDDDADADLPVLVPRIKNPPPPPWKSLDLNEYKVYKNEPTAESAAAKAAADASTQTDERRQRRRAVLVDRAENPEEEEESPNPTTTTELGRDEISISPPPSSSSPETLETLIRADGRLIRSQQQDDVADEQAIASLPSGRMRASAVLMHLISCGSIAVKDHPDLSLASQQQQQQYRRRIPRAASDLRARAMEGLGETPGFAAVRLEDRDYFSGSLIETKTKKTGGEVAEFPGLLKRSSSYNADRSSKLETGEKEAMDGVRAKCIPRKPKTTARNPAISRSTHGSKRINDADSPKVEEAKTRTGN